GSKNLAKAETCLQPRDVPRDEIDVLTEQELQRAGGVFQEGKIDSQSPYTAGVGTGSESLDHAAVCVSCGERVTVHVLPRQSSKSVSNSSKTIGQIYLGQ